MKNKLDFEDGLNLIKLLANDKYDPLFLKQLLDDLAAAIEYDKDITAVIAENSIEFKELKKQALQFLFNEIL